MGALGPTGSFVADVRESPVRAAAPVKQRQPRRFVSSLLALGLISLLVSTAYFAQGNIATEKVETSPDPDSTNKIGPGFKVYGLRELSRTEGTNQTSISFTTRTLPFDFNSLVFGDYASNPKIGATYYAGSGMILNVSGPSGNVTLKDMSGRVIRSVCCQGQASIVFNGETVYTSTPKATTTYEGTDILVQDWLKGTWSPEEGVVLERPTGMTIDNSEFYLMVFQPPAAVPEFGVFPAAAVMIVIVCVVLARFRRQNPE